MIENCKNRKTPEGYVEKHHIIPKCMGGSDDDKNLVCLSAREHFIAHKLLFKIHRTYSLAFALSMMCRDSFSTKRKITSAQYQFARKAMSESQRGKTLSEEHKRNLKKNHRGTTGQKRTVEQRKRISESLKGKSNGALSEEHKRKISQSLKGKVQKPVSEETRKKMSESAKKRDLTLQVQAMRKANIGTPCSEEKKLKISQANKGRKRTEEQKLRMREGKARAKMLRSLNSEH